MPLWSDASGFAPLGGFNVALCGASLPSILYDLLPHAEWDPVAGLSTVGYDLSGRRTTLVSPAGKFTYSYDAADELLVQYTPTGSVSYGYDPNGSRIYQQSATARTTYLWDPRNRLQQVTLPTGSLYTQTYRPDDMRLSESSSTGISTMVWSNNDVLGMVGTQSGSPMQQVFALAPGTGKGHTGGGGIGIPLSPSPTASLVRSMGRHADGSTINRAYHTDNQGGILAITTATGSIEADYHTDSWGNVISGTAADNPYVYLGGLGYWEEPSLSLNYVRARWQEPSTGSWLSVDSVRTEPRYLYAHNSPTRLVDASGRQAGLLQGAASAQAQWNYVFGGQAWDDMWKSISGTAQNEWQGFTGTLGDAWQELQLWIGKYHDLFNGLHENGEKLMNWLPPALSNLRPPIAAIKIGGVPIPIAMLLGSPLFDLDFDAWLLGVGYGFVESAIFLIPIIGPALFGIKLSYDVLKQLLDDPGNNPWKELLVGMWNGISSFFTKKEDLTPFQRGEILGNIIVMVVSLLESILDLDVGLARGAQVIARILNVPETSTLGLLKGMMGRSASSVGSTGRGAGASVVVRPTTSLGVSGGKFGIVDNAATVAEQETKMTGVKRLIDKQAVRVAERQRLSVAISSLERRATEFIRVPGRYIFQTLDAPSADWAKFAKLQDLMTDAVEANRDALLKLDADAAQAAGTAKPPPGGMAGKPSTRGLIKILDPIADLDEWNPYEIRSPQGPTRELEVRGSNAASNSATGAGRKAGTNFADMAWTRALPGGGIEGLIVETVTTLKDGITPTMAEFTKTEGMFKNTVRLAEGKVPGVTKWTLIVVGKVK